MVVLMEFKNGVVLAVVDGDVKGVLDNLGKRSRLMVLNVLGILYHDAVNSSGLFHKFDFPVKQLLLNVEVYDLVVDKGMVAVLI